MSMMQGEGAAMSAALYRGRISPKCATVSAVPSRGRISAKCAIVAAFALFASFALRAETVLLEVPGGYVSGTVSTTPVPDAYTSNWFNFEKTAPLCRESNGSLYCDVGSPIALSGVRYYAWQELTRHDKFSIWGTNGDPTDKAGYTMVISNTTGRLPALKVWYDFFPLATPASAYRYYEVRDSSWNDYSILFRSEALHVTAYRPEPWASTSLGAADHADGVLLSGCLEYAPSGSAAVEIYVATRDWGTNYDDWRTNKTASATVADVVSGAEYSVRLADLPAGDYYVRTFAVAAGTKTPSQATHRLFAGTSPYYPTAYYPAAITNYSAGLKTYDGSTTGTSDCNLTSWIIFGLDDPDVRVVSVRFWPRGGGSTYSCSSDWARFFSTIGATAEAIDFSGATDKSATARTRKLLSAEPTATWTTVGVEKSDKPCHRPARTVWEIPITDPVRYAKALKVSGFVRYDFQELELRTLPMPQEPDGTASVDSIGASFARVVGTLVYRGNAASDCSLWFVTAPAAGGAETWTPVGTSVTTGDAFDGTVFGLAGETTYSWRVVASNALAGAVLGTGAFTTLSGGGPNPVVTFEDVQTNADGSVSVSYDVASAGDGCTTADVILAWGTEEGQLTEEMTIAEGVIGSGTVTVTGLPFGTKLFLALKAANGLGRESDLTEARSCTTVGPCGLADLVFSCDNRTVTVTGKLSPRGLGDAVLTLEYGEESGVYTRTAALGTVPEGTSAFSFSATLDRIPQAFCRVKAVNGVGTDSWTVRSSETSFALGLPLPCLPTVGGYAAFTGVYGSGCDTKSVSWDVGAPLAITGVRFMLSKHESAVTRMQNFTISASADGTTYETIFNNNGRSLVQGGVYISYPVEAACRGPYRYFRADCQSNLNLCDIRALSQELSVEGNRPYFWTDKSLGKDEVPDVCFSGRLLSTPAGTAHVYIACARRDLGTSLDTWRTGGRIVDAGVLSEGASFSVRGEGVHGVGVCRYFAVSGTEEYATPYAYSFTTGTKPFFPATVYMSGSNIGNGNNPMKRAYDGSTSYFTDCSNVHPIVFPLDAIPAGWRLASVRIWARSDCPDRVLDFRTNLSFDDADLESIATTVATANDRTVKSVETWPAALTWTETGVLGNAEKIDFMSHRPGIVEVTVDNRLSRLRPKFLKVARSGTTGMDSIVEIELRLVKEPGLSIIVR